MTKTVKEINTTSLLFILPVVTVAVIAATNYTCNSCTTLFQFGEFAGKEVWAASNAFELMINKNVVVNGPNGVMANVGVGYAMMGLSFGSLVGFSVPNLLELTLRVDKYVAGEHVDQSTFNLSTNHLNQQLAEDGRTTTYPIVSSIAAFLKAMDELRMFYDAYSQAVAGFASPLYSSNPYYGIPVYSVSGSHINTSGMQFMCTTNNGVPCL